MGFFSVLEVTMKSVRVERFEMCAFDEAARRRCGFEETGAVVVDQKHRHSGLVLEDFPFTFGVARHSGIVRGLSFFDIVG
jgi:hypothetical protein